MDFTRHVLWITQLWAKTIHKLSHFSLKVLIKSMIKNQRFYPARIVAWSFVGKKKCIMHPIIEIFDKILDKISRKTWILSGTFCG